MPLPVRVYQQHSLLKQNFTAHIFADGTKHIWIRIKMLDLYSVVSLVPLSVIVSLEYLKFNQIFFMCQTRTVRPKWQKSSMLHLVSESNSRSLSNSGVSISWSFMWLFVLYTCHFFLYQFTNVVIRYDTRCYFNMRSKADISQLNLPHGTDNWKCVKTEKLPSQHYLSQILLTVNSLPLSGLTSHAVNIYSYFNCLHVVDKAGFCLLSNAR